jgi:hypothetical protein
MLKETTSFEKETTKSRQQWDELKCDPIKREAVLGKLEEQAARYIPESKSLNQVSERLNQLSLTLKDTTPTEERISQSFEMGKEPFEEWNSMHWIFILRLQVGRFQEWAKRTNLFGDSPEKDSLDDQIQSRDQHIRDEVAYHLRQYLRETHRCFEKCNQVY